MESNLVKTFEYHDAAGKLLYAKERCEPGLNGGHKSFAFMSNWKKERGSNSVLYNLPALTDWERVSATDGG